jgi:hypothetical protein
MSKYLNLNLTEDDNTKMSSFMSNTGLNQAGGFFWNFSNGDNCDNIVMKAVQLRNYHVVDFFVNQNLIKNYGHKDANGCTLLHYLAREVSREVGPIIDKILEMPNIKSFINIQDNNGDTPLHVATKVGNHEIAEKLVFAGCDKSKKNNDGQTILSVSENMTVSQGEPELVSGDVSQMSEQDVSAAIQRVVDTFMKTHDARDVKMAQSTEGTLNLPENLTSTNNKEQSAFMTGGANLEETEVWLNNLISKYSQAGGNYLNFEDEYMQSNQKGGSRFGRRQIPIYADNQHAGKSRELSRLIDDQSRVNHEEAVNIILKTLKLDADKDEDQRTARRLKGALFKEVLRENREISSPLDLAAKLLEKVKSLNGKDMKGLLEGVNAHEEAVKIIMEKLEVAEPIARSIKAVMWRSLREENPNVGNLELSVMLGKKVTKATKAELKKIDPSEGEKIREESKKRREEGKTKKGPRKSNNHSDSEISATSEGEPEMSEEPSETSFSA